MPLEAWTTGNAVAETGPGLCCQAPFGFFYCAERHKKAVCNGAALWLTPALPRHARAQPRGAETPGEYQEGRGAL